MLVRAAAYQTISTSKNFFKTFLRTQEQETKNKTQSHTKPAKIHNIKTNRVHAMSNPDFHTLFEEEAPAKPKGLLKSYNQVQKEPVKQVELKDLDLEAELLAQYNKAQEMLDDAGDQPLNQKAQTINAITSILQAIIKSQQELYNIERLKTLENTLIKVLQEFPALKHKFLEDYEKELKKI